MFEIVVYRDGVEQRRYTVSAGEVTVGRAEGNEILLQADSVSRRHARFTVEDGRLVLEDLGSGNGTYIAGQRVVGRVEVGHGHEIQITPFVLKIEAMAAGATTVPTPAEAELRTELLQASPAAPASPPRQDERTGARLILRRGEADKSTYMLTRRDMTIGRSEDRDIVLTDPASSRRHATLVFAGDHYYVRDEGSANGLVVNNEPTTEAPLYHGDRLIIGETEFELIWPEQPGPAPAAPAAGGDPVQMPTQAMPVVPPPFAGVPAAQPGPQAPVEPAVDPYSETGVMPVYDPMASQGYGAAPGYVPQGGYGVELGGAPTRKRNPLRTVAIALVALLVGAIIIKVATDQGGEDTATRPAVVVDPCANVGDTCPDATDQACLNCLAKRGRINRGKELFAQKEFGQAIQEFQRVLQDIDPLDQKAMLLRYVSYEYWVLSALDETLKDRTQTLAQKIEQLRNDFENGRQLLDRYGKYYSKDTPESTLSRARSRLNEAVSLFNDVLRSKVDDPEAEAIRKETEKLRTKALNYIYRISAAKKASAEEAFQQEIESLFNQAMSAKASGKLPQAQSLFKQVLAKDPDDKSGKCGQARQELASISRAMKERAKPLYQQALTLIRNEQWVEARIKLQQALKIDPEFAEAQGKLIDVNRECTKRAQKMYSEAKVQYNIGQYAKAEKLLKQALIYAPDPSSSINQKAKEILKKMGKL